MNKYNEYQKELRNKKLLKIQCIAVALIIAFTLSSGTAFAYVMLDNSTPFSRMVYNKLEAAVMPEEEAQEDEEEDEEENEGYVLRCRCGKTYKYDYRPENTSGYYCTKCGSSLENTTTESGTEAA